MVIFTVAVGEEVGGGGSGGDAVDDFVVQWQGGSIGVNTLDLSKLTRKRTTVERRSRCIILRRDVVDKKRRKKITIVVGAKSARNRLQETAKTNGSRVRNAELP